MPSATSSWNWSSVNSIAPDELAVLIRAALLAVGHEDRDPVCIRDALWLAATMNAADHDPVGKAWPGADIWHRPRSGQEPFAATEGRDAGRSALLEEEPGSGAAELFDDGNEGSPRPAQGIPARRVALGGPSSLRSTTRAGQGLAPIPAVPAVSSPHGARYGSHGPGHSSRRADAAGPAARRRTAFFGRPRP